MCRRVQVQLHKARPANDQSWDEVWSLPESCQEKVTSSTCFSVLSLFAAQLTFESLHTPRSAVSEPWWVEAGGWVEWQLVKLCSWSSAAL